MKKIYAAAQLIAPKINTSTGIFYRAVRLLFLFLVFSFFRGVSGQTTIIADGFNSSLTYFTATGTGAYYLGNSTVNDRPANSPFFVEGTAAAGVTNGTLTLTSNANINTTGYTGIQLSLRAAAFSINSGGGGLDAPDDIVVQISTNGGASYTPILTVSGNSNAYWAYSATGVANATYPTANTFAPAGGGNRTTDGYSTLTISSLPAIPNLRVRIIVDNSFNNERWVIDDFKITGMPPVPTISGFSPSSGCANTTPVVITGTNFTGATAVQFGGTNAASFTINSSTQITATPAAGTTGTISVTTPTGTATSAGTFTVNQSGNIALSSGNASPTICINNAITNIVYAIGGSATGATLTGSLPAGVSGSFAGSNFTISGTPTASGTFNYTVSTTGSPCTNPSLSGTITVDADATITLTSAAGTDNQTKCANSAISNITYAIGGSGTGVTLSGSLPAGVTGAYSAGTYTISGTPTATGTFNYTVTTTGPCIKPALSGSITVNPSGTISRTSAAGTDNQVKCINTAITNITYAIGGDATGASITAGALPAGVTGSFAGSVFTISGTPTASGNFSYTVGASGSGCANLTASGTITVNDNATISLSSAAGTDAQTVCALNPITNITYSIGGFGTTGATVSGLPAGVNGSYSGGVFTISGSPSANGTFNYTVTTTGPCTNSSLGGTIDVNTNATVTRTSGAGTDNQTVCINNAIANITYAIGGDGNNASITAGSLPAGVTGSYSGGVFTISGTPTAAGVFNYTVTASGSACSNLSANGTITVNNDATISLSSAPGTDNQTKCINTAITNITYAIGGGGTGATVSGLPAGVTGSYSGGVFTISGTPTASGTFNYTVSTTGPCIKPNATGTITVQANSTLSRTSAAGTDNQTVCINNAVTNITYSVAGGGTGASITAGSLPAGVTGSFSAGVFTISGTPTVSGAFSYTVTTTGPCTNPSLSGTITVNDNATIVLTSAAGTDNQTKCISTAITNITYSIGGGGTGATVSGLPAGVTGNYNSGTKVFTISGTPTASGTFNYTVSTTGPCIKPTASGTIVVQANSVLTRTSAAGTDNQTVCINNAITNITYSVTGGGTGASITAGSLPAGVTGSFSAGVFTISGTPTVSGAFSYTVTTTGPCTNPSLSGTMTVNDNATILLTSAAGTDNQTKCISTAITNITYSIGGFGTTGATVSGLPAGVSGNYNSGTKVFTISGTPTTSGTFNYTVSTTGPCIKPTATGTITVQANSTITRTSAAGTDNQTKCINNAITNITYAVGGGGTGASITAGALPPGVSGSFSGGVFTISGTPTASGVYNYTVTTSGPCTNPSLSGTITVNDNATIALTSAPGTDNQTKCINTAITNITYSIGGFGTTGATVSGLPAGVSGTYNAGTKVFTISGTPTASGTFNYTVSTTGPCIKPTATGTITVTPNATIALSSAAGTDAQTLCNNIAITNITYSIGGSGTGASITAGSLPAGVTGSFSGSTFTISGTPSASGTFNYTVTTTGPCGQASKAGTITVIVAPTGTFTATETSGLANNDNIICAGATVTFTAPAGYGAYTFKVNGTIVQGPNTSNTYSSSTLTNGQSVTVDVANASNCGTTFGPITITVNPLPTPTLAATETSGTANDNIVCAGDNVTFTAGGGTSYNFKVNGVSKQSGASVTYSTTTLANGSSVTVDVLNANGCVATSAGIVITVNALPSGTLTSVPAVTTICAGDNITFTATAGFANYNFKVNGSSVQSSASNTFSSTTLTNGQVVTVDVTNASGCMASFGPPKIVTVNPLPAGTFATTENSGVPNNNEICTGSPVTFTAQSGYNNYKFYLNGAGAPLQNGGSNIYTTPALSNNDYVTVVITTTSGCSATFTSPNITVVPSPVGTLSASATTICAGDNIDFTATAGFANYNFKVNGTSFQNGSSNIASLATLVNGDVVTVDVSNAATCLTTFNSLTITVNALPTGTLTVAETSGNANNDGIICTGANVVFTATAGFANYNFKINNATVQFSAANTYATTTLADGDIVSVEVTNGPGCVATFNTIGITVNTLPTGALTSAENSGTPDDNVICAGADVTFTATAGFTNYNFKVDGISVQNSSANIYSSTTLTNGSSVTVDVTNTNGCISIFGPIIITVNPVAVGTLTAAETSGTANNDNIICDGANVTFTATAGYPNYDFKVDGISVLNSSVNIYSTTTLTDGAAVTVDVTNTNGCVSTFGPVTIAVKALPVVPAITGTTDVCVGSTTQLSNTTGGGIWSSSDLSVATINSSGLVTGVMAGTSTISYSVTNADGCNTTVSTDVNVNPLPVPTLSGPNPICPGSIGTYTTESGQSNYTWTITGGTVVPVTGGGGPNDDFVTIVWNASGPYSVYVNYTNSFGCSAATSVTVTGNTGTIPVISGPTPVCLNSTGNLYTTQTLQSNYTWSATGGTITSGGTTADNTATVTWTSVGAQSISVNFTDINGCTPAAPTVYPVTVRPLPTATISGTTEVCQNAAAPSVTFTGANATAPYTFTYNINGGSNLTVSTSSGNSVTVSAPTGTAGTFTYNLISVSDNNTCSQSQTGSATITVNPLPTATISGTTAICQNSPSPDITFTGSAGTAPYIFTYNINGGASQTVTSVGNTATLPAPTATAGTFVYNLVSVKDASSTTCSQNQSGSATITVNPLPTATISGTIAVCQSAPSPDITFTGAGGTSPYTFTYNVNGGPGLTVVSVGNTATVPAPTVAVGTYTYNLVSVQDASTTLCSQAQSGSAIVTVDPTSIGGSVAADNTVCSGTNTGTLTLTGNVGNVIMWELSTDGGTTWTPVANTTTSLTYNNLTTTTQYRAVVQSGACSAANSSVATITVNSVSVGGTVASNAAVCSGTNGGTLTLSGHNGGVVRWESSTDNFVTITTIANTTTSLPYSNLIATTKFRAVVANGVCAAVNSASATITVNPLPTATISGTVDVCQNALAPNVTFTGAGGTAPYTFTYKINAGGNLTIVSVGNTATVSAPTGTVGTFTYSLVSVQDASSTACSQNQSGSAVVTVYAPPPAFLITPASATICQGTVQPLSASTTVSGSGSMTFNSTVNNVAIPDAGTFGPAGSVSNTISVSGIPAGAIINSVSVNFNITHGYDDDLILNLKAPNNNVLNLVDQRGADGNNFTNTTVSSASLNPFTNLASSTPFNGIYRADGSNNVGAPNASNVTTFPSLYGTPNGNWVFEAADVTGCHGNFFTCLFGGGSYYAGTLNNWSITINYTLPTSPLNVTWSPVTDLYTDPGATTAYTGQSLSTVYSKPSTSGSKIYTATATNAAGCSTSQNMTLTANPTPAVTITADYCAVPGKVRLTATSVPAASSYIWSTGQTTSSIDVDLAGVFDVTAFTAFSCPGTATINVASELVTNGDFEAGNVGFASDYLYKVDQPGLVPAGQGELYDDSGNKGYSITPNGQNVHINFWGKDHTTGNGNFMAVNGHGNTLVVWKETVNVLPNTTYYFSAWAMSLNNAGPFAQLQFSVNGSLVGTTAVLAGHGQSNGSPDNWVRFYGTWTSGPTTTTADIYINNLQPSLPGNDFGLDDVSFATLSTFITLISAPGTDGQTVCLNTPITNIVYRVGNGSTSGPTVAGLPAGITSVFAGDKLTFSGTPTLPGNYTYTITTVGCNPYSVTGTITVEEQTITLTSGSSSPTLCVNSPVTNIVYTVGGTATAASITSGALPAGMTGIYDGPSNTFTISGTPTTAGVYNYTVKTSGTCLPDSATGTITVEEQTITLSTGSATQTVCQDDPVSPLLYTVGGTATGAGATGLPPGVTGFYSGGSFIISGTPTMPGTFNYTVTTTGTCSPAAVATGTITVDPAASITLTSAAGTDAQTLCINDALTDINYSVGGGGTNATVSGLPVGVSGSFSGGTFTITGTPTAAGTFTYTVTTTGTCAQTTATGTITVQSQALVLTSGAASPTLCIGSTLTDIVYTISGTATGATLTGSLPTGITGSLSGNVFTISGSPTQLGTFPYSITTTGPCTPVSLSGTITVNTGTVGGTLTSPAPMCSPAGGILNLAGNVGTVVRWESSVDGGTTWANIANTTTTLSYSAVTMPTQFRALVKSGSCAGIYSSVATMLIRNYWTGATDTDWNTASNWSDNALPTLTCDSVIIANVPNQPVLSSGAAGFANNLVMRPGATLEVTGNTLHIAGGIYNDNGSLDATTGTIDLNGSGARPAQTIAGKMFFSPVGTNSGRIQNLQITNPKGVTVASRTANDTLNITGTLSFGNVNGAILTTNDNITLVSNASGTARAADITNNSVNNGNTISGGVVVERYLNIGPGVGQHNKSWQLLAIPTQGQTVKQSWMENGATPAGYGTIVTDPSGAGNGFDPIVSIYPSMKTYKPGASPGDPSSPDFMGIANTAIPIYNKSGYMVFIRGDRTVTSAFAPPVPTTLRTKGALITGNFTAPLDPYTYTSIGNPYASAIDMRPVMSQSTGVTDYFQLWSAPAYGTFGYGNFVAYTLIGSDYVGTPGGGTNNNVQSGQAFFVQNLGNPGGVVFRETSKVAGFSNAFFTPVNINGMVKSLRTDLSVVGPDGSISVVDGTLHLFGGSFSDAIDGGDARKLVNAGHNFYINEKGVNLIVEKRTPVTREDTIFFNMKSMTKQNYQLEFKANGLGSMAREAFLEDLYLNTKSPISLEGSTKVLFTVSTDAASYSVDRFRIVFAPSVALPVTLTNIKAYREGRNIEVGWDVENEINMKDYTVEKSGDGSRFAALSVKSATGNAGLTSRYDLTDGSPYSGDNYYRIRSNDIDGKTSYSKIVKVFMGNQKQGIAIIPNPIVDGMIHLQFMNEPGGNYGIRLLNHLGQVIMARQITRMDGSSTELIKWDFNLAHGLYRLEVTKPGGSVKNLNVLY